MKRYFAVLVGLSLILTGLVSADTLCALDYQTLTVYSGGEQTYAATDRAPSTRGQFVRIDTTGDSAEILATLGARVLATERYDDLTVIYAFSPHISAYELINYGRVNVMVAVRDNGGVVVVGVPLIKGAY